MTCGVRVWVCNGGGAHHITDTHTPTHTQTHTNTHTHRSRTRDFSPEIFFDSPSFREKAFPHFFRRRKSWKFDFFRWPHLTANDHFRSNDKNCLFSRKEDDDDDGKKQKCLRFLPKLKLGIEIESCSTFQLNYFIELRNFTEVNEPWVETVLD